MKPVRLEILIDDKTLQGLNSVKGNLGSMEQFYKQAIGQLKSELTDLQQKLKSALSEGINTDKQAAEIQALTGVVNQLTDELEKLKIAKKQNNATPIIGEDPAPKMNNIKMSMAQIARELPAITMGPQMFFLAISNNIPLLQDALSSARKEFNALTAAGKTATPVWKQVAKSIVSPQAAIAVGITLLTVYGDEIVSFAKKMLSGKKEVISMKEAVENLNEEFNNNASDLAKSITTVNNLAKEYRNLGDDMNAKKEFITKNKEEFDKLDVSINNVADADKLLINSTDAYIEAMSLRAEATAAYNLQVEAQEELIKKQRATEKRKNEGPTFGDKAQSFFVSAMYMSSGQGAAPTAKDYQAEGVKAAKAEEDAVQAEVDAYQKLYEEKSKASKQILERLGLMTKEIDLNKQSANTTNYAAELAEARIKAQQKLERMLIETMQEGFKKRQALAAQQLQEEIDRINADEKAQLDTIKKARAAGQSVDTNAEQQVQDNARQQRLAAEKIYWKAYYSIVKEWRDKDIQSWIEYNKEFGDSQDKRMAIIQDYNRKIAAEETDGGKAILRKRMEAELSSLDMEEFKNSIDFSVVFGDLEAQTTEALETLREKLRKYIETMGEELKPEDLKEIQDAFKNIDFNIKSRKPFEELSKDIKEYKDAQNEVEGAQIILNQAMKFGSVIVEEYDEATGEVTKKLITQEQAEKNLTDAQKKRKEAMTGIFKSLSGVSNEVSMVANAANSIINTFDSMGIEVGEEVRGIVAGFTAISDGIGNMVEAAMRGDVAGVIAGVIGTLAGTVKMFGSIFGADWGGEKSRRRYEEAKEKYESYMDVLDKVINKQKELVESMEADDFANANNSYERAKQLLKDQQDYAREMGKAYLASGASKGFLGIGSSASEGIKQKESISKEAWKQVEKLFGADFVKKISEGRMTAIFDLSYEQLLKMRDEASGFYSELHEDTRMYIDQIIESEEAWREVQEARKEALTKMDFDSFYDSFVSTLKDLDATNEEFAQNFEDYLKNAIFSALVANQYKSRIESLYNQWADLAEEDGLDSTEADLLRQEYNKIVEEMLAKREELMEDFGWESEQSKSESQSGRAGAVTTITEETAGRLEGIGNAQLDRIIAMDDKMETMGDSLSAMASNIAIMTENSNYLKRLEDIADNIQNMNSTGVKIKG